MLKKEKVDHDTIVHIFKHYLSHRHVTENEKKKSREILEI